jgi:oxaloacetate decarboxylase gamma subunit
MESSIGELLASGVKLMLIGMGIVYTFLLLLVWVIQQTHKIIGRLGSHSPTMPTDVAPAAIAGTGDDSKVIAAIAAAIHRYEQE